MKRTLAVLSVCSVAVSGCGSTSRAPRLGITLDRRIGAVTFGDAKSRVDAAVGPSVSKKPARLRGAYLFYPRAALYVGYYSYRGDKRAIAIITHSPRYRTPSGVGVGTTLAELRKRVRVVCDGDGSFHHGVSTSPATDPGNCNHPIDQTNHPFTWFVIDEVTKRVTQVAIVPGGD